MGGVSSSGRSSGGAAAADRAFVLLMWFFVQQRKMAVDGEESGGSVGASVKIEPWTPNVPYVKTMNAAGADGAYAVYLQEREKWGATPAFYLDAGETLLKLGRKDEGRRVLLSLADLAGDDPAVLRILARRLLALGEHDLAISLFRAGSPDCAPRSRRASAIWPLPSKPAATRRETSATTTAP